MKLLGIDGHCSFAVAMMRVNSTSVNMLWTKYSKAVKGESEMEQEFVDLSTTITEDDIKVWTEQETVAMRERGDKLNIYNVNLEKGMCILQARFHLIEQTVP